MLESGVGPLIGRNVRELRERRVYSREQLAEVSGVSAQSIKWLELGGTRRPQRHTIEKLAEVLGVAVEDLASEEPIDPKAEAPSSDPEARRGPVARNISAASGAGGGSAASIFTGLEEHFEAIVKPLRAAGYSEAEAAEAVSAEVRRWVAAS